jgi:hypothetical protein
MANAAGVVVGSQGGVPGQTGDTRGPQQLANEVSAANGGVRGPLTRQHWNTYYERRINDAMELLPPDQAVRVVGMLDQQRQRGFGQMISLAVAAAEAGDAQGATRALFGASNFMPDGFKDDFRVAANGRGIDIVRTPESGRGETQRMTVPLDQVARYATTMLDPKWSMTHQLQVRQLDESARAARVREGHQAEDLRLRRDDREERRRIDLNSGQAIESATRVARAQVEYDAAIRSGDQGRIDSALEKLNTEEAKDAELVGMGINTRGAAGRQQAASAVQNAATRRETAEARMARWNDMTQLAQESLALRTEDRAAARTQAAERLTQHDRGLDIRALSVELRNDVARSRLELSQARDDNTKRIAEERLRIAEERLNLAVRTQSRREGDEGRITPQTRTEADRALDAYMSTRPQSSRVPVDMLERFVLPTVSANPRMLAGASIRMLDQFMTAPNNFVLAPDFSQIRPKSGGPAMNLAPEMRDYLQSQRSNESGAASPAAPAAPGPSRGPTSMQRPAPQDEGAGQSALNRSMGRATPAPNQRTAAPTSRPGTARPRTVDAWVAQNAPAEGRGGITDRELQQAAGWYNVPVTELRQRMRTWRQVEIPGGL